jgi:glucokinase
MSELHAGDWLLVEIDGATAMFGLVTPSINPRVHSQRSYSTDKFSTATDCFSEYAKDVGISLRDRHCGMAVSGAVTGDSVRIQRCRWIVSITGLSYLTGSPLLVVNDSVAKSWINASPEASKFQKIGGMGFSDVSKAGKWTSIHYHHGLGAAIMFRAPLNGDSNNPLAVLDSECGHIGFAPQNDLEQEISSNLARVTGRVTYEQVLFLGNSDPIWDKLSKTTTTRDRDILRAGIFGSFAGDMTLAFASWSGVYLHGEQSQFLSSSEVLSTFNNRFEAKLSFASNVRAVPRYLAGRLANSLPGLAEMMASIHLKESSKI